MTSKRNIGIHVPVLARVEGEGALDLEIEDGQIRQLQLRIYEPPRLFEKFLEGRSFREVPDMVARICGICPVAYQMSAVQAIERAFGVQPDAWVEDMRRVLYCGEWIQSHALHIHLLAAPDFLGFDSAVAMAAVHPEVLRRGLRLQDLGNRIIALYGGRSVHPVGVRVGGFHRAPSASEVAALRHALEEGRDDAMALLDWALTLPLLQRQDTFASVSLCHDSEYPLAHGVLTAGEHLRLDADQYLDYFREVQVSHSTALHSALYPQGLNEGEGQEYLVGPLARLNHNFVHLPDPVRVRLQQLGFATPSRNMFHSLVARAAEIALALFEALRILQRYKVPRRPFNDVLPRAGTGAAFTEAPRGILWHRYELEGNGIVRKAQIVPPTSQNQRRIESDLRSSLETFGLDRPDQELRRHAETVIRNYDPCISCATHFLQLRVRRH